MSNYKHLTFWSLVDRMEDWRRCCYAYKRSNKIGSKWPTSGCVVTSFLCPGVAVCYDNNNPVHLHLNFQYRDSSRPFGMVWLADDGTTIVRYSVPTMTANMRHGDKLMELHHWLRGRGPSPTRSIAKCLPQHEAEFDGTRIGCSVRLADDGEPVEFIVDGRRPLTHGPDTAQYFSPATVAGSFTGIACRSPLLRCWDYWTPAKRALGAVEFLRRVCEPFGKPWVRPFLVVLDGQWTAGVCVVHPKGESTHMLIRERSTIADIEQERGRIASWAMHQIEVPGPMF
jgi:hypothetical protein